MENESLQDHAPELAFESRWPWPLFALALAVGLLAGYHYYELYSSLAEPVAVERR